MKTRIIILLLFCFATSWGKETTVKVNFKFVKLDTNGLKKDTISPKSNLDSILVLKPSINSITYADKLAKQSQNNGSAGMMISWILGPIGLVFGIIAISKGKKAISLNTKEVKKAKSGILMGKLIIIYNIVTLLVVSLFIYVFVQSFNLN
jgi:hypothetical protein